MADSSIAIKDAADATRQVDARTLENGDFRQTVSIGDPATAAGVAPVDATYGVAVDVKRQAEVSAYHVVGAGSTNAASVKAAAGKLRGFSIFNASDVPIYLKFHNTAVVPTAGAGVVRTFGIQAGVERNITLPGGGLAFATGIGITVVRDLADAGVTPTVANDAVGEIFYE